MARIRSIHVGLFTDEAFMAASMPARLLIPGLWVEAWDDGVFEWKPLTLKAKLFPVDNVDVAALLEELASLNFVRRFERGGKQYGAIRNFGKFQRPKKPNSSGVLPPEFRTYVGLSVQSSEPNGADHEAIPQKGENGSQMEDGGGNKEDGENKLKDHSSETPRELEPPRPFPEDGSIAFSAPFADIARRKGRGADPDVLASAFRRFCREHEIDFREPNIATKFETFCGRHKIRGLHA